jgi:CHAD domain-containing protein
MILSAKDSYPEFEYVITVIRDLSNHNQCEFDVIENGLRKLDASPPGAPIPDGLIPEKKDLVKTIAQKVLQAQSYKMRANTEGTILDLDAEFLHDVRVATRRARFALKLLKPFFKIDYCDNLRQELAWIADLLGKVRDIDVFLPELNGQFERASLDNNTKEKILKILSDSRQEELKHLITALESSRYNALIDKLKLPEFDEQKDDLKTEIVAEITIKKSAKKLNKFSKLPTDQLSDIALHKIRVLFKGLRYTCEFFSFLYGKKFKALIKQFVQFQDCLGINQDAYIAMNTLNDILNKIESKSDLDLLGFGSLYQIQKEIIRSQRKKFDSLWENFPQLIKELNTIIKKEQKQ